VGGMVVLLLIGRLLMMMVNSDWIVKVRIHGEFRDKTGGVFAFFFFSSLFFFLQMQFANVMLLLLLVL